MTPCPVCGLQYAELRTGLTFAEVRGFLWSWDPDPRTWGNVTRRTVLGRWREIKLDMWEEHLACCR